ncbi:MAG: Gx transporter family protein [Fusobacteriota bacterium]
MIAKENDLKKRKMAFQITLILMAVYFSLAEGMVPKPFPWIKLGLANISTILGMKQYGMKFGLEIVILRIIIFTVMVGTFLTPGFIISISSGLMSSIFMGILLKQKIFSLVAVSSLAGVIHNITQLLVVYVLLFKNINILEKEILVFIIVFLLFGFISGALVGIVADNILNRKDKNLIKTIANMKRKTKLKEG